MKSAAKAIAEGYMKRTHKARWISGVCPYFAIDFDEALLNYGGNFTTVQSVF
jgi:hypothetical protein